MEHTDNRIKNRILDMYSELISSSYTNFRQTNNTIQQIEGGLREMWRAENNVNNTNIRGPLFNNDNTYNTRNTRSFNSNSLYPTPPNTTRHSRNTTPLSSNIPRPSTSIRPPRRQPGPTAELFTRVFSNAFNMDNLTPVTVRPTLIQIENATENITMEEASGNICPITQSPFQEADRILRIHHCGHCFIENSLHSWFERSVLCPVCRYDIRDYIVPEQTSNISTEQRNNGNIGIGNNSQPPVSNNVNTPVNNIDNSNVDNDNDNDNEPNIENLVNTFTEQVTNTLREYVTNNVINSSNDDGGVINFEYVIQTPTNTFTTSSTLPSNTPSSSNLNNLFFNNMSANNSENIEEDGIVDGINDVDEDWEDETSV